VDGDGNFLWTQQEYAKVEAVTIGDVDGDGNDEAMAVWRQSDGSGALVVFDETGAKVIEHDIGGTDYNHHRGLDVSVYCRGFNDGIEEIINDGDNDR